MANVKDVWSFKYEPKTMDEYLATPETKERLMRVIEELPNTMLFGRHGIGKGTFMNILLRATGCDYLRINGSKETSVDVIRDKVETFATSKGSTRFKIVYYNEADNRRNMAAQEALLELSEKVHNITRFFFVGNYLNRMIPELKSRCEIIEFDSPPIKDVGVICMKILKAEGITQINKGVLVKIIRKFHPDMRKLINTLKLSVDGNKLDRMIITSYEDKYKDILNLTITQDIDAMRKILRTYQIPYDELYEYLFENLPGHKQTKSPGDAIIEISEAMYRDYFVTNKEINFLGMVFRLYKKGVV
jgi:replication-associated recombination protein RarA